MAQFHFVEDYERVVANLIATHPIDEAMSLAVGGAYDVVGSIETDILRYLGLTNGMSVMDLGCGSGRLSTALSKEFKIDFTGADVVQSLLDYAKTRSDPSYKFILHRELSIPLPDRSRDFFTAFSVFTHLLHHESYIYLQEAKRILKPNGLAVFSFLEFSEPIHWPLFDRTISETLESNSPHLNMFIERTAIQCWADRLEFSVQEVIGGSKAPWGGRPLGQSVAVLRKS